MTRSHRALSLIAALGAAMSGATLAQAAPGDVSFAYGWATDAGYGFEGFSAPEATNPDQAIR